MKRKRLCKGAQASVQCLFFAVRRLLRVAVFVLRLRQQCLGTDVYPALAVDLRHLDLDLVSDLEHILYLIHTVVRDLGDVQQTIRSREQRHDGAVLLDA